MPLAMFCQFMTIFANCLQFGILLPIYTIPTLFCNIFNKFTTIRNDAKKESKTVELDLLLSYPMVYVTPMNGAVLLIADQTRVGESLRLQTERKPCLLLKAGLL